MQPNLPPQNMFDNGCLVNLATSIAESGLLVALAPSKKAVRIVSVDPETDIAYRHKIDADHHLSWSVKPNGDPDGIGLAQFELGQNCLKVETPLVTSANLTHLCQFAKVAVRPSKTGLRIYAARQDRIFKLRILTNGEMQFKSWLVGEEEPQIDSVVFGADIKDDEEVTFDFFENIIMNYNADSVTH